MSLDALLNAEGLSAPNDKGSQDESSSDEEGDEDDDLQSLASADGKLATFDHIGAFPNHSYLSPLTAPLGTGMDIKSLKQKDPEFYKYLQENDRELLDFDINDINADDDEDDQSDRNSAQGSEHTDSVAEVVVTRELLRSWQKSIIEASFEFLPHMSSWQFFLTNVSTYQTKSMRALRKLLLAFKSAAFSSNDKVDDLPYTVESSSGTYCVPLHSAPTEFDAIEMLV